MRKIIIYLAAGLLTFAAQAETLTVCDGTSTTSEMPFDGIYNYDECSTKSQMIYPAEMLTDMVGAKITHITFYPTDGLHFYNGRLKFRLSRTSKSNYDDLQPVQLSGLQALTFPHLGLPVLVFELGGSFVYRGGNLVLEVSIFENGYTDGITNFYGADMDYNASLYYADANEPTAKSFLPKATFTYQYGTPEPPTPDEYETFTVNGVSFKMIYVEGGTFMMGASDDDYEARDIEKPAHEVTLSSYSIGETEVTQELWTAVMGNNPSYSPDNPRYPVEEVSWYDCQAFILKLNEMTGRQFRLPTEAEWEFAARGGNKSQGYKYAGSNTYYEVMWCAHNFHHGTEEVASKAPNELGLYDMSGNVWEWCQDYYGNYSSEAQTNPICEEIAIERVRRGGGWSSWPEYCRVSYRSGEYPRLTTNIVGMRLALTEGSAPEPPTPDLDETFTVNGTSFKMIHVDGGSYLMGATQYDLQAYANETPAHVVTLSPYCIGETEVTQELWTAVMGNNPSYNADNLQCPVENVSWLDCQSFVAKLNELTGRQFRLPTEAEWEFAARGGNKCLGYNYAGSNTYDDVTWCASNCTGTNAVASKAPNELGLYDMSGNVWEWCQDYYGSYSSEPQTDPTGPDSGHTRVQRGGGWSSQPVQCRATHRNHSRPTISSNSVGLRLALTPESTPEPAEQTAAPEVYVWTGAQGDHTQYVRLITPEDNCEMEYRFNFNNDEWTEWIPYEDVLAFTIEGTYELEGRAQAPGKEWSEPASVAFVVAPSSGVEEVVGDKLVVSKRYYNMAGQEMTQPQGMTIIVTTFTDGTTTAAKVMK